MSQIIEVREIFDTRNPLIKTLYLFTRVEKSIVSNPIGFFLQGNFPPSLEERVAFHSVSLAFIERFGIVKGCPDFNKAVGHECKIVAREGFQPMRLRKVNGRLVPQEPKKVPHLPFDVYLTKDGQPIYRNTYLEVNPTQFEDILIQHDPLPEDIRRRIAEHRSEKRSEFTLRLNNPNIMAEPTLD